MPAGNMDKQLVNLFSRRTKYNQMECSKHKDNLWSKIKRINLDKHRMFSILIINSNMKNENNKIITNQLIERNNMKEDLWAKDN